MNLIICIYFDELLRTFTLFEQEYNCEGALRTAQSHVEDNTILEEKGNRIEPMKLSHRLRRLFYWLNCVPLFPSTWDCALIL